MITCADIRQDLVVDVTLWVLSLLAVLALRHLGHPEAARVAGVVAALAAGLILGPRRELGGDCAGPLFPDGAKP